MEPLEQVNKFISLRMFVLVVLIAVGGLFFGTVFAETGVLVGVEYYITLGVICVTGMMSVALLILIDIRNVLAQTYNATLGGTESSEKKSE